MQHPPLILGGGGGGGGGGGDDGESTCTVVHASGILIYCANCTTTYVGPFQNVMLHSRLQLLIQFLMNFVLYTDGLLTGTNLLPGVERKSVWPVWVAEGIQDCLQTLIN